MTKENIWKLIYAGYPDNLEKGLETSEKSEPKSIKDNIALIIATCGGVGYIPIVPASWGSLASVGIYLLALMAGEQFTLWAESRFLPSFLINSFLNSITIVLLISLFLIGIWASTRVGKLTKKKDPRIVVIDEVVGQLITFLLVPAILGWWTLIAGFLLFRFFDILKPYPANKLESLPSGLGIMADDVMAGFYAAASISLLCTLYLAFF